MSNFAVDDTRPLVHGGRGAAGESTNLPAATTARVSADVDSIDHVQEKPPTPASLTMRQKAKRHCGRFKWWYLGAAIILLIILLPVLFLVILPAIVQRIVSSQALPVNSGAFVAISPTEVMISLNTSINTPIPAVLDTTTLFLYNATTPDFSPFLNVSIPSTSIGKDTAVAIVDQKVQVTNETELEYWFNRVFDDPSVDLSVRGDTIIWLSSLHYNAHIEKTIQLPTLDYLRSFGIEELSFILPPLENGTNIHGTLSVPNWGVLRLDLGDISFGLFSGNVRIGLITIYGLSISPGNNSLPFYGELFFQDLVQNFGQILDAQSEALGNGQIQIDAVGNATVIDGQHIPYVERVLNNKRLVSYMSVVQFASDLINGVAGNGGNASIVSVLDEILGNKTLIEQVSSHWNSTGSTAKMKLRNSRRGDFNMVRTLSLWKIGKNMFGKL